MGIYGTCLDYGMVDKCVKIYSDTIDLYKFEPRRPGMELIGGYSILEIDSFNHVDLAIILKLLTAKGKVHSSSQSDRASVRQLVSSSHEYQDALNIYERCQAAAILDDHSIVL